MKACKIWLCFCVLTIGLLMPSVTFAQGDDHWDDATNATAISTNGTLENGVLEVGSDLDYFEFIATNGVQYTIETSQLGVDCDTYIRLFDTDGITQIDFDDDSGVGLASRIDWVATASGTFYVSVEPFGGNALNIGTYKISVTSDDHGNDAASATLITANGTLYDGDLEISSDVDYFEFNATNGVQYTLDTSQLETGCDTEIKLFDTDGTTLIDSDDDGGWGFFASRIDWVATASGTFYVSVEPMWSSSIGTYKISVTPNAADDHGNDHLGATPVSTDGTRYDGVLEVRNDRDYFSFNTTANLKYIIQTTQLGGSCDTYITLYDSNGTTRITSNNDIHGVGGGDLASNINYTPRAIGTFYVSVEPYNNESGKTGTYKIFVSTIALAGVCDPCTSDADCESGRCASFESGPLRCVPVGVTEYTCVVSSGGGGGGGG